MNSEVENLLDLLTNSADAATIIAAAKALGSRQETQAVMGLIEKLKAPQPAVRKAAAIALGNIGDPSALDALFTMAAEDKVNRRVAIDAVLYIGSIERLDQVINVFQEEKWNLKMSEAKLLGKFADRRAVPLLVRSTVKYVYKSNGIEPTVLQSVFEDIWARG